VENHIHILTDIHPSVAVADFVKEIKGSSSKWLGEKGLFPGFKGWAEGYGAFSCSYWDVSKVTEYIKNQEEHHKKKSFEREFRRLILEAGLNIDEKYFP
jgi:REP element-mobilizing transposase RayT